ncbi:putative zinc-type alcohol dehydrogenase-like protein YjmD [subsurface metagenome]
MKAAVLNGPKDLKITEVKKPDMGHGEVLVRIEACGICTLEQRLFSGDQKIFYPIVAGHEASGTIEAVHEKALTSLKPGNRVALDLLNRCGACYYCRIGADHLCENRFKPGQNLMGGFGEYISIPASQAFLISDELSYEEAALTEPLSTCLHSFEEARVIKGETVVIIGAGTMGLLHLILSRVEGNSAIVCDLEDKRLQKANTLGADKTINPVTEDAVGAVLGVTGKRGADVVILTASGKEAFKLAMSVLRPGGRIVLFAKGNKEFEVRIEPNELHSKEISLIGVQGRTSAQFHKAVSLLNGKKIDISPVISEKVSLNDINSGMARALDQSTYRVLVTRNI